MLCPKCSGRLSVIDSRDDGDYVYRKRKCDKCGHTLYTEEIESADSNFVRKQLSRLSSSKQTKQK